MPSSQVYGAGGSGDRAGRQQGPAGGGGWTRVEWPQGRGAEGEMSLPTEGSRVPRQQSKSGTGGRPPNTHGRSSLSWGAPPLKGFPHLSLLRRLEVGRVTKHSTPVQQRQAEGTRRQDFEGPQASALSSALGPLQGFCHLVGRAVPIPSRGGQRRPSRQAGGALTQQLPLSRRGVWAPPET